MKLRNVVQQLIEKGHSITFRNRKDGGIIVKTFDGQKFTGAEGNKKVREVSGQQLSTKKKAQLESIRPARLPKLPKTITNQVARINRKLIRSSKRTGVQQGRISIRDIRKQIDEYGLRGVERKLQRRVKYLVGIAYSENVMLLLARMRMDYKLIKSNAVKNEFNMLYNKIATNIDNFRDEWIYPSYEVLYEFEKGLIPEEEMIRQLQIVIKL